MKLNILTVKTLQPEVRKFLKHGYLSLEGQNVVLTEKGQRVLLSILFEANKASMLEVLDAAISSKEERAEEAEQA